MSKDSKVKSLISKIETSKIEAVKAQAYSEGYFDCISDFMEGRLEEITKVFDAKYDGSIRLQVYSEILPTLKDIDASESAKQEQAPQTPPIDPNHPSVRAKEFMARLEGR